MSEGSEDKLIAVNPGRLLELERVDPRRAERLWHGLRRAERLRVVLDAPAEERERLITLAPDSAQLTRMLPPDEFARTVMALGPADAGGLLADSTDQQMSYVLDLTGWVKERFAPARYEAWLPLLLDAGGGRILRWLKHSDPEVLTLLFAHWMRVEKFLPSQEQQEPPDDLPEFTLDGVYFIEFRRPDNAGFVGQVLVVMKSELPELYAAVLDAMIWDSAAHLADAALRWRQGRMADLGFPDRLEAMELWAAGKPGEADWQKLPPKSELGFLQDAPPRSDHDLGLLPEGELLPAAAGELDPAVRDTLRAELAYVANCGVVALDADPAQPEQVERAARESLGMANLGLGLIAGDSPQAAGQVLARVGVAALARRGAAALRGLNRRAWALVREGWLSRMPASLYILDPPLDHWLAGLVFPRPRCYAPGLGQGREYRSFTSLADLEAAEAGLALAELWGRLLFDYMGLTLDEVAGLVRDAAWPDDPQEIKLTHVMGTWLARRALGMEGLAPIPSARLGAAVAALQTGLQGPLAEELLRSVQALEPAAEAELAGELLRETLERLRQELGGLDPDAALEPAFVGGLVLAL